MQTVRQKKKKSMHLKWFKYKLSTNKNILIWFKPPVFVNVDLVEVPESLILHA